MANLAPFPIFRAFDSLGKPLAGGQLFTYVAGTTTLKATFTDDTGATANTNPVILDSRGEARVWLDGPYSMTLQDASGVTQWTVDNVTGVGSGEGSVTPVNASEWLAQVDSPTFISATQYSVPGDRTAIYHVGRRHRAQVSGGVAYSTITNSVFGAGITTVTLLNDSIVLDGGLSALAVGINSADNPSISSACISDLNLQAFVPTGTIFPFGGAAAPAGFLVCDGSSYTVASQPGLHAVIGDAFGGDGGTNFNVPDLRGRGWVGVGQGDTAEGGGLGTARSLADKGGAETHTLTSAESGTAPHGHTIQSSISGTAGAAGGRVTSWNGVSPFNEAGTILQADAADASQGHANMHPFLVLTAIIKT